MPDRFNIADAICRRHLDAVTRLAIVEVKAAGANTYTFGAVSFLSDKFANVLAAHGLRQGEAVAIILPPSASLAVAHFGALKAGAAVVPLSLNLEPSNIQYALRETAARAIIISEPSLQNLEAMISSIQSLEIVFVDSDCREVSRGLDFWREVYGASSYYIAAEPGAETPAYFFYSNNLDGKVSTASYTHGSILTELEAIEATSGSIACSDAPVKIESDWATANCLIGELFAAWWRGCAVQANAQTDSPID
ncbi:MAG TPA: AMP-binding protein [Blastocatellia bacterium]|nr:AMP-binding protein [Blastocatellia bacterium]